MGGRMALFERLKTRLSGEPEGAYECAGCGRRLETQRQACPECGSFTIDRAEW